MMPSSGEAPSLERGASPRDQRAPSRHVGLTSAPGAAEQLLDAWIRSPSMINILAKGRVLRLPIVVAVSNADLMNDDQLPDATEEITGRILLLRGQRVLLDADLASMYGVSTKRFNEQVRRNRDRFPQDFCFVLEDQDFANLRSQFATSSSDASGHGGRRHLPRVFTEHGAIMAAMVLNSPRAIQMSVYVVRAFVKLRAAFASDAATTRRLDALERSVAALDSNTRRQFEVVYDAILGLMGSPSKRN